MDLREFFLARAHRAGRRLLRSQDEGAVRRRWRRRADRRHHDHARAGARAAGSVRQSRFASRSRRPNNDRLAAAQAAHRGPGAVRADLASCSAARSASTHVCPAAWDRVRDDDPREPGRDAGVRHRADGHPGVTALSVSERRRVRAALQGEARQRRSVHATSRARPSRSCIRRVYLGTPPDEPTTVTLPAPRGATKVYENDMGEFGTRLVLYSVPPRSETSQRARPPGGTATASWSSSRAKRRGIVWATVWDSPVEAAEFSDAMIRAATRRTGAPERRVATRRRHVQLPGAHDLRAADQHRRSGRWCSTSTFQTRWDR